jgi:hypothetical protein
VTERIQLKFESKNGKRLVANESYVKISERQKALFSICGFSNAIGKPLDTGSGPMLEQSQEEVFLVFEMRVNRPLAPARGGGDLIQLSAFKSISYKDLLCGLKKSSLSLLDSKLLSSQSFHGLHSYLNIPMSFPVDKKLTGQYLVTVPHDEDAKCAWSLARMD